MISTSEDDWPAVLPLMPGKVIAVHLSYRSRADQRGRRPACPSYFLKPASSLADSDAPAERPEGAELLGFEGEIALIIARDARWISPAEAWSRVGWVTAANDLGLYDLRVADKGSNLRSKGRDGYTPIGPSLIPARQAPPDALRVRTWLDGVLAQSDTTADMLFDLPRLVADLSQHFTLRPGDIVLTGTPAGASVAQPGEVVEVEVDAPEAPGSPTTGRLRTPIVAGRGGFDPALGSVPKADDHQRDEAWGVRREDGLDAETRELLMAAPVAGLTQQMRKRGMNQVVIEGVRPVRPSAKIVGRARTLRFLPAREDLFAARGGGYNPQKRAFDAIRPGEVLVIEARGETGAGTLGDILALRAQALGAAGVVTDGMVRDLTPVAETGLGVFCAGGHPAVLGRRHVPWDSDLAIACGGAAVVPGDVIVGDDDGVVVIPAELAAEVARAALAQEAEDAWIADRVREGEGLAGLFPLSGEWRERYQADHVARRALDEAPRDGFSDRRAGRPGASSERKGEAENGETE